MAFDAETLVNRISNEQAACESAKGCVKMLRHLVDRIAKLQAKDNANWHDDPDAEDHAAFHADAIEQFPRDVRNQAIRDLVDYWVDELDNDERNKQNAAQADLS